MFRTSFKSVFASVLAVLALGLAGGVWAATSPVDVNKANQADLETVKGIGPGLSGRILQARTSGSFKDWNDMIERVQGVGAGNAKRFSKAGLTVAGAGFDGAASQKPAQANRVEKSEKSDKADKLTRKAKADSSAKS